MSSTWLYVLIAAASLMLAAWQPDGAEAALAAGFTGIPDRSNVIDRASRSIEDRKARHQQRWNERKAQFKEAGR